MMRSVIFPVLAFGAIGCVEGGTSMSEVSLPLTSQVELAAYLNDEPADSPLRELSPSARQRFLDNRVFGESGGVGSFFYGDLKVELSDGDGRALLRLFDSESSWELISPSQGMVAPLPPEDTGDIHHYYCASRATCAYASNYICKSNC